MKQINTLYGQNEFIIRLVVLIDTTVLCEAMCDILKADFMSLRWHASSPSQVPISLGCNRNAFWEPLDPTCKLCGRSVRWTCHVLEVTILQKSPAHEADANGA